ncbi:MAG: hypothetical protein CL916_15525, partial [Deltaproteobacteria bacterium]|nr:hypothetical protein [Deltaproteobacteria bacterium]
MVTWPLTTSLHDSIIGILHIDFIDTIALRHSDQPIGFWPTTYYFSQLQPNRLDFYTFIPFRNLGFPLADNLWWMSMLAINGWCGHFMGQSIRGSIKDGFASGILLLLCETTLRESALHHAPQIMFMGIPLFIGFWIRLEQKSNMYNRAGACFSFILTSLAYWYYGLFLVLAIIPFMWSKKRKELVSILIISMLCLLPFVYFLVQTPMANITRPNIPHNPWFFQSIPADKSGRISILLILAFGLHLRSIRYKRIIVWTAGISIIAMSCSI